MIGARYQMGADGVAVLLLVLTTFLGVVAALSSARVARIYFYLLGVWYSIDVIAYFISHLHTISLTTNVLVNLPHILILGAAFWIATKVDRTPAAEAVPA